MVVDLDKYTVNKQFGMKWLKENKERYGIGMAISTVSYMAPCPTIIAAFWAGEAYGWVPEVVETISRLKGFYGYEDIVGKPPGCPV
jgi:hypothetical protein